MSASSSTKKTFFVAFLLCSVCSVVVSSSTVFLRPIQKENKALDVKKNLLISAGLITDQTATKENITSSWKKVIPQIIVLKSGLPTTEVDVTTFNPITAVKDPLMAVRIEKKKDISGIKIKSRLDKVYYIKSLDGSVDSIVLPIRGKGLWSTLYGFIALDSKLELIKGLGFYQHGETPGLGGEIDNPSWKASWVGKTPFDGDLSPIIEVIKGKVIPSSSKASSQIDGLAGATLTSRGVSNLVKYWLGDDGFGPFLKNFKKKGDVL